LLTIFAKLGVSSRTEAVLQALKRGWINPSGGSLGGSD
jgi:DNA-binding NarL/FixJ family response regulator